MSWLEYAAITDMVGAEEVMSNVEESEHQQLARNLGELLQELRVTQGGVQILFGFLLSIAFTDRYARAAGYVKGVWLLLGTARFERGSP